MEGILNFVKENPGLVFMALGIIGFIWAITGGGLKTKVGNLPPIDKSSRKYVWIISSLIFALGVTFYFVKLHKENNTNHTNIVDEPKKDPTVIENPEKPKPPPPQNFILTGVLMDVFNNRLGEEFISIWNEEKELGNTITDEKGIFEFDNIPENTVHTINYIDSSKRVHVKKFQPDSIFLKYIPYNGFKATICKSIDKENKKPVHPYDGNNIVINADSLMMESTENLHVISCFMEILGSHDYSKGKILNIYLDWYFSDRLIEDKHKIEAGMSTANSGFRTWGDKKVWKGKWKLVIRTESGHEIDHIFIELI